MLENIDETKLSPMMRQYMGIKKQYEGILLFFRLGDFYELFFGDALIASQELELTLTKRKCGNDYEAPMCGVPHHSADTYIKKLVNAGYKVAICEQGQTPVSESSGIVTREVTRVITKGTISDANMLDESKNNYICSIYLKEKSFGICFADVSTGVVYAAQINSEFLRMDVLNEIDRFSPSELLYNEEVANIPEISQCLLQISKGCASESVPNEKYDVDFCKQTINNHFGRLSKHFEGSLLCLRAVGALIDYLNYTQKQNAKRINSIRFYNDKQYIDIDYAARRNLEITQTIMTGEKKGSLLGVIDKTKTSMGKRMMRNIIERPLVDIDKIKNRQDAVGEFLQKLMTRDSIRDVLTSVYDIERLTTKAVYGTITPREMKALGYTISNIPTIKQLLSQFKSPLLSKLNSRINSLEDLNDILEESLEDEPPANIKDGGFIKDGFKDELDELRDVLKNGRKNINQIEKKERERTKIPKLKIGYNRVFGYYIEVTKSYKDKVPSDYVRKQTVSNAERYATDELRQYEQKVSSASEGCIEIEQEIYTELKNIIMRYSADLQITAQSIAMLDVLSSFAVVSQCHKYVKPDITSDGIIDIKDGRHPVVENMLDLPFVPNDVYLDQDKNRMNIITGPNMAGKSTYMRQVALIVILSQIGCFVPATSAKMTIVDKIFTRIGAADDLSSGRSTFMVEMSEVAKILAGATSRSLVILDEIGRGTSTFDGMSIAKAVAEYISSEEIGCKTLFATHYHELTELENEKDGVVNYNIAVKKRGEEITFLRKIVKGGVDDSYGIIVAKLAGLPKAVIDRANEILKKIESKDGEKPAEKKIVYTKKEENQMEKSKALKAIKDMEIDALTPIECMNLLHKLKSMVNEEDEDKEEAKA